MELFERTYEYILQGGWVMIPLAVASIILWVLMLERLVVLRRLAREDLGIEAAIHAVRNGGADISGRGLRAELVRSFLAERTGFRELDVNLLRRCAMRERRHLSKSLAMIGILVSVAPLLGLLGTVLGMIETFQVISVFGTGNASAMANGISVALITTESGLLIAVPGLLLSGLLLQQSYRLTTELEEDVTILTRIIRRPVCSSHDRRRYGTACDDRGSGRDRVAVAQTTAGMLIEGESP